MQVIKSGRDSCFHWKEEPEERDGHENEGETEGVCEPVRGEMLAVTCPMGTMSRGTFWRRLIFWHLVVGTEEPVGEGPLQHHAEEML